MIYYNNSNINDWNFGDDNIIKVYRNNAVCYYKITTSGGTSGQTPCFAVVDDISQYSDTEFKDVFNKDDEKWYKLNNLNQYEEYGIYGSGRTITYYDGKLTVDNGYEYQYSGNSWVNVGEVSGSSKTSGFTIDDINNDVTVKSSISDSDYYVISYYNHNNPKEPQYMMSYQTSNNYLSNFSGYTGSNAITPSTIIDAAIWKFEATSTADTYYIKNIYNNLYWGYQTRVSNRSLNLVGESDSSKAIVKVGVANSATTVGFVELNVNGSRYTYEDGTVGGYALNQLNRHTYMMNWWNTGDWGSDGNSAFYLYKIEGGTIVYPIEYAVIQDPPNNITFTSMTEAESYECPWVGMSAIINGDKYVFSGDSQSGYEWVYNPSRLPVGYTEVEYVENTGTSYFNTNFVPNQDTRVVCDMQLVAASDYPRLWGAGAWNSATGIQPNYEGGYLQMSWLGNYNWTRYTSVTTSTDRKVYDVNKNYLYVDSVQIGSNTYTTITASDPIGVFTYIDSGRPSSSSYWGREHFKGKMYSFQIYDNGTLVRDLVPCIRDNDDTVGAYDIVNNVFYTVPTGYTTDKLIAGNPV